MRERSTTFYPLNTPATVQELAAWANGLVGQDLDIQEENGRSITYRIQELQHLWIIPQPDGRATALAQVRVISAYRLTRSGTMLA